jgi:hypothetical protein
MIILTCTSKCMQVYLPFFFFSSYFDHFLLLPVAFSVKMLYALLCLIAAHEMLRIGENTLFVVSDYIVQLI